MARRRWQASAQPLGRQALARYFLRLGDREIDAEIDETPDGLRVNIDGTWRNVELKRLGNGPRHVLVLEDRLIEVIVTESPQAFQLQLEGSSYEVETVRRRPGAQREEADQFVDGRWVLRAPMTGIVVEVRTEEGSTVDAGETLIIVEAMKMLNELKARVPGTISAIPVTEGDRVEIGDLLLEVSEQI